jgi:DNA-binding beta-propeller fold protein YncE
MAQAPPASLVQTIGLPQVEGRIDHLATDGQRLFVAALGNDTVEVLDLRAGLHVKSLKAFREPQGIAVVPDAHIVAVANGDGEGLQLFRTDDFGRLRTISLGNDSDNVRYDASGKRMYVGFGGGALAAVNPLDGTVIAETKLAAHPESFQLERSGARIFVNLPGADQIAVVDRTTMKVITTWPVVGAKSNFPMALDEDNHRLLVGCRSPARALVFDTTSGKVLSAFDIVGDTDDLFYDVRRKRVYVTGGDGFLDAFQDQGGNRFARIAHVPTAPGARTSLFVAEQDRLYLAVPHRGRQPAEIRVYDMR